MIQEATATASSNANPASPAPLAAPPAPPPAAPADSSNPDSRATTFQAVQGGTEQHSGSTLLVEAYAVLWIILMAWLLFLWRRQATLRDRLDAVERAVDRAAEKLAKK